MICQTALHPVFLCYCPQHVDFYTAENEKLPKNFTQKFIDMSLDNITFVILENISTNPQNKKYRTFFKIIKFDNVCIIRQKRHNTMYPVSNFYLSYLVLNLNNKFRNKDFLIILSLTKPTALWHKAKDKLWFY